MQDKYSKYYDREEQLEKEIRNLAEVNKRSATKEKELYMIRDITHLAYIADELSKKCRYYETLLERNNISYLK